MEHIAQSRELAPSSPSVRVRSVALPSEHGAWGFLTEPILFGLLVAFTLSGILLSVAIVAAFLIHQPLKIAIKDYLKHKHTARTQLALKFTLLYGVIALAGLLATLAISGTAFLLPFALAIPLVMVQLYHDAKNKSRDLLSELSGAMALATTASALVLLDGWQLDKALAIWVILALRDVSAILYVRTRLRLERGKEPSLTSAWLSHGIALLIVGVFIVVDLAPIGVIVAFIILTGRALWGISPYRATLKPTQVGIREMIYGLGSALIFALAYVL